MGDLDQLFNSAESRTVGEDKDLIISLKDNFMIASKYWAHNCVSGIVQNSLRALSHLILILAIWLLTLFYGQTEHQCQLVIDSCLIA